MRSTTCLAVFGLIATLLSPMAHADPNHTVPAGVVPVKERLPVACYNFGTSDEYYFDRAIRYAEPIGSKRKGPLCARVSKVSDVQGDDECDVVIRNFLTKFRACLPEDKVRRAETKVP